MSEAKILFIDIETAPDLAWVWGVYQENAIAIKEHWYVISFAAKWRGADKITVKGLPDYKGYKNGSDNEKKLLKDIWELLDEADVVVAHNGYSFDIKKLNARFIDQGYTPPSPYKIVDTKRDLKSIAAFSSNRLNWLCKQLGIGQKTMQHQDWSLWEGCINGDKSSWKKMKEYNRHDVVLLEELYLIIAPWIRQPNANLWNLDGQIRCVNPACGSTKLQSRGTAKTLTRVYRRFQCQECGTWSRSVKSETGTKITPVK
jgi:uncharacterized protein YprB with RNaseH-like and TPR domain